MKGWPAYLGLRLGVGLLGLLPGAFIRKLGELGGLVWYALDRRRRQMARRHMHRVLGDEADLDVAARSVMVSYGRYWAEAFWVRRRRIAEIRRGATIEGLDHVVEALEEGRGMILALPHIGNWEFAAPIASEIGLTVVAVAEALENERITRWFTAMRGEFGIEIVLTGGRTEVMRSLEAALAANKAVALLSDRDLRGRGVEVDFFGERTTLPPGPATLAIKTGAPLFPVASYFADGGHHVVVRPELPVPEGGVRRDRVQTMTQLLALELENLIRRAPDQWHLVVPNWPSDRE